MLNVFVKKSAKEVHVELSDGRIMLLEDLVRDYERLFAMVSQNNVKNSHRKYVN